jgi:hypothetical protein
MLTETEIKIKVNNRYINYYKEKGYLNVVGNSFLVIKIEDLPKTSHYKIDAICADCNKTNNIKYYNYVANITKNNKYVCNNCKTKHTIKSNLIKYGVKSTLELDSVKEKSKKTMMKKYGVNHYSKTEEFKNIIFDKYGVKSTLELDSVKEKSKKTMLEKYGVDHYSKSGDFIKKVNICCNNKYNIDHYSKTEEFKEIIRLSVYKRYIEKDKIKILNYDKNVITSKCEKNHIYLIDRFTLKNRLKYKTEICTICNPIGSHTSSGYENQLQDFVVNNYKLNVMTTKRFIIKPLELDIYLPDLKLAFEFNGLYWHNEISKDKNYHLNKTELCEQQGIQLIHIYEDDWLYKQNIVKSMILNKLGKIENKVFARKCEIRKIDDNNLVRLFLDENHIQGFVGSKVKIGLFYENELVSLMTFGRGNKPTNEREYELLRFCNKLNTCVLGGASKLFKYFIKNYNPTEIITTSDRSFSQGKLYEILGFEFIGKTKPNYYYIIDGIRHHRFNFIKDKLIKDGFDPNKTEHQIMLDRKIFRIYDSGNLKFIYTKNNN